MFLTASFFTTTQSTTEASCVWISLSLSSVFQTHWIVLPITKGLSSCTLNTPYDKLKNKQTTSVIHDIVNPIKGKSYPIMPLQDFCSPHIRTSGNLVVWAESWERKIWIMVGDFHRRGAYDRGFWRYFKFNLLKRYPIPVDIITQSNSRNK